MGMLPPIELKTLRPNNQQTALNSLQLPTPMVELLAATQG